ncbi:hypothetical protein ACIBCN_04115 [Nocardia sp. NPDC051052]|uniref:hypothetical protein n=1 Tax=Nocardia sp. NPDC051052 TaxID=3364322 RepID=UPI0037A67F7F
MSLSKVGMAAAALFAAAALTSCSLDGDSERATVQQILSASAAAAATTPAATTTTAAVPTQLRHMTCEQVLGLIAADAALNKADSTWTPGKFVEGLISKAQSSPRWEDRSPEDRNAYLDGSRDALTGSCP